ncbi:HIT family protein [Promicromonospora sukumoe]|uniref:HIT family protein n=1 Tax=Promicromonospora sukumoe TaxID=88382 RepID=UPI00365C39F8
MVHRDEKVFAIIAPRWWPRNAGHVLIIPVAHHENLYGLPADDGHAVFDVTQRLARAMRTAYGCAGVSTRQHNEPAGNQDVWHFHQHLFPRYPGDDLDGTLPEPDWLPTNATPMRNACGTRSRGDERPPASHPVRRLGRCRSPRTSSVSVSTSVPVSCGSRA